MKVVHKLGIVAGILVLLASPLGSAADQLNIKPGLWEIKSNYRTGGAVPIPKDVQDKLTPEQRAKIVAAAQAHADKPEQKTARECITEKDIREPFHAQDMKDCQQSVVTTTRTTQEMRIACTGETKGTGVLKITTPTPETMSGSMDFKMGDGADVFTVKGTLAGKWLSADCGDEADSVDDADEDDGPADDNEEEEE
jgi:hypothetical protein